MCGPSITNFVMSRKYAQIGLEGLFKHRLELFFWYLPNHPHLKISNCPWTFRKNSLELIELSSRTDRAIQYK